MWWFWGGKILEASAQNVDVEMQIRVAFPPLALHSSWAFAAVGAIESAAAITNSQLLDFSTQEVSACLTDGMDA